MKKYLGWICFFIAIIAAAFAGWVDFNNDEPQAAVLVILVTTALLGWLFPVRAWLWAIIVGLGLPSMYLILRTLGYHPFSPPSPGWYASLLALIPAFIGSYAGALGRVVINKVRVSS
ncbi:MAG TPA: hypothetical protein VLD65_01930 [Anaerolineales bacterium]|nr:hypothetical protein [Anaerolineales bacterium]